MRVIPLISEEYRGPASTFIILCSCHKNVLQMEMMETVLLGKKRRRRRRKRVAVSSFLFPLSFLDTTVRFCPYSCASGWVHAWQSGTVSWRWAKHAVLLGKSCSVNSALLLPYTVHVYALINTASYLFFHLHLFYWQMLWIYSELQLWQDASQAISHLDHCSITRVILQIAEISEIFHGQYFTAAV